MKGHLPGNQGLLEMQHHRAEGSLGVPFIHTFNRWGHQGMEKLGDLPEKHSWSVCGREEDWNSGLQVLLPNPCPDSNEHIFKGRISHVWKQAEVRKNQFPKSRPSLVS